MIIIFKYTLNKKWRNLLVSLQTMVILDKQITKITYFRTNGSSIFSSLVIFFWQCWKYKIPSADVMSTFILTWRSLSNIYNKPKSYQLHKLLNKYQVCWSNPLYPNDFSETNTKTLCAYETMQSLDPPLSRILKNSAHKFELRRWYINPT